MATSTEIEEDVLGGLDFPTPCIVCPRQADFIVSCRRCGAGITVCDPCLAAFIEHANRDHNGWAHCQRCENQGLFAETFATTPIGGGR